jgi:hypothetical protein
LLFYLLSGWSQAVSFSCLSLILKLSYDNKLLHVSVQTFSKILLQSFLGQAFSRATICNPKSKCFYLIRIEAKQALNAKVLLF